MVIRVKLSLSQVLIFVVISLWAANCYAQELTPRAYWPAPRGTKVLVTGYSYSDGAVLFAPSVPLYDVDTRLNVGVLAYLQTVNLWGRSSNILVELPYSWGTTSGSVVDIPAKRDFAGFADIGFTMTVNLLGAPTMTREDFLKLRADPPAILGASLKVIVPTGYYESDRLINIGTNRWALRAQLGSILPIRPTWLLELTAGTWFFGDDEDFLPGKREQDPIFAAQANVIKRIRPGLWASLDFTYFRGGRQMIGGNRLDDLQQNTKIGGTLVLPFRGRHAIKVGYAKGVVTKFGSDFDQFLLSYQQVLK